MRPIKDDAHEMLYKEMKAEEARLRNVQ
jgi:hypothetical protein